MSVPGIVSSPGLIGQSAPIIWSLVGNTYSNDSSTINYPSGIQAGDIIVMADYAARNQTTTGQLPEQPNVIPSGFSQISTVEVSYANGWNKTRGRLTASIRRATSQLSGSVTGMSGSTTTRKCMAVFRGSSPFTGMTVADVDSDLAGVGANGSQSISSASGIAPLIAFGFATVMRDNLTMTNYDGRFGHSTSYLSLVWRFFDSNETPQNVTVTAENISTFFRIGLISCFVQCTTT